MHLFRPSLSFLAEAQPRLENRRGQKAPFGRGAHYIIMILASYHFLQYVFVISLPTKLQMYYLQFYYLFT
jgi:hypothetical protein